MGGAGNNHIHIPELCKITNIQSSRSKKGNDPMNLCIQVFLYCLHDSPPISEVNGYGWLTIPLTPPNPAISQTPLMTYADEARCKSEKYASAKGYLGRIQNPF